MMKVMIRQATASDFITLTELGRKTFYEKWKETTPAENMERYLAETYSEEKIRAELTDPANIYLIAEIESAAVGFAKLLFAFPDIEEGEPEVHFKCKNPIEVSRLYVSPELLGKSIGTLLMQEILDVAREKYCDLIWLGVWEHNPAVKFYLRHGFQRAGTHKFMLGEQVDTDLVMVKML